VPRQFRVVWTESASEDAINIIRYIAKDSLYSAEKVFRKLRQRAAALRRFPYRGQIVPELEELQLLTYRQLVAAPYRILYRIDKSTVFVTAVVDSRRDLKEVAIERLLR